MSTQNDLSQIREKINEIEKKSADGEYIYRGEPKRHKRVSSTLYRHYAKEITAEHFDIEIAQDKMLRTAADYIQEADEVEILTLLQHYGGKTNLIDFTTDYLIALFFACDGFPNNHGRLILLKKTEVIKAYIEEPRSSINRVRDQKSIFVRPPKGSIEPALYTVINIPKCLKHPILNHLRKYHNISTNTMYKDLHGFIRVQKLHQSDYTAFYSGLAFENRRQYDKAITHYTKALELNPQLFEAYNNRGNAYRDKGEFDRAIADHYTAIQLKSDDADAYNNRGLDYYGKGENDLAFEDYNRAIRLKPDYADAYNNRGLVYHNKGEYELTIKDYEKAIRLKPDYAEAYKNRGDAYCKGHEYELAIEDYEEAIRLKPDYVEAHNNRGLAYHMRGDYELAIKEYEKAIRLKPDYAEAYKNRGDAYCKGHEYELAVEDYEEAIRLKPDYTLATYDLCEALLAEYEWEQRNQI